MTKTTMTPKTKTLRSFLTAALPLLLLLLTAGCDPSSGNASEGAADPAQQAQADSLDVETLRQTLGMEGTVQDGQFKVGIPQNDLDVTVDGVKIVPPMGMGSWAAFAPTPGTGAMLMGDVVVKETEVQPVQQVLTQNGLTATALHKHFLRETPRVMYMHIGGTGSEEELATGVKAVFDKIAELRGGSPADAPAEEVPNTLDTGQITEILGHSGAMNRGVYKVTIPRSDLDVTAHGAPVTGFMGLGTWAAWQGTPEEAAVAGDFAMTEDEVKPVIQTLAEHGIEVVSIHNHMVQDDPQVFFLHYWGQGPAEQLARGLRAALDETGAPEGTASPSSQSSSPEWTFEDAASGSVPAGWKIEATNPSGQGAQWSVQQDQSAPSGRRVLALTNTRGATGSTFNLAWTDEEVLQDGTIEVKVKAGTGREDQGGGPVWRVQDKDNYYVARWNPLEDNFRVYYVKNGNRDRIASANVQLSPEEWQTITIRHDGQRIEASMNGERLIEVTDDTFSEAGGVGVWTKADAATSFDDLSVSPAQN